LKICGESFLQFGTFLRGFFSAGQNGFQICKLALLFLRLKAQGFENIARPMLS